jgi:hypothetical protein
MPIQLVILRMRAKGDGHMLSLGLNDLDKRTREGEFATYPLESCVQQTLDLEHAYGISSIIRSNTSPARQ